MQFFSNFSRTAQAFVAAGVILAAFTVFAPQANAQVDSNYYDYGYNDYYSDNYYGDDSYDPYAYATAYSGSYYGGPTYMYPSNSYGTPSCTITLNRYSGGTYGAYGSQLATLAWSAYNANSVSISPNVGAVTQSGTVQVYPTNGQVYIMTVYGPGGYNTCSTQPFYQTMNYGSVGYYPSSYITLTQIPYTGLEAGAFANMLFILAAGIFFTAIVYLTYFYTSKRQ